MKKRQVVETVTKSAVRELSLYSRNPSQDTALALYLQEISEFPLIDPAEEVRLYKRIKKGDKMARETFVKANLRLVVKIARDYEPYGLPLLDLINEGNMGLMKAVDHFRTDKGAKFSTYAVWWIKQSVKRGLNQQSKTIRLPVHMYDKMLKMRRVMRELYGVFNRDPTHEEVAEEMCLPVEKITYMMSLGVAPMSLNASIEKHDSRQWSDVIEDSNATIPSEELERKTNNERVALLMKHLDSRERKIIESRYGFDGGKPKTLEEIGAKFNVTRERIRQVQQIAQRKLRRMLENFESCGKPYFTGR